jgi:formiminotetrahydrofolate cyclodeaminase
VGGEIPFPFSRLPDLLDEIGKRTPSPGGGAVAALTGALGAAQLRMVAEYGSWDGAAVRPAARLKALADALLALSIEDAAGYAAYAAARKRRKEAPADYAKAVAAIAETPVRAVEVAAEAAETAAEVLRRAPAWFAADVSVAAGCLEACGSGAGALATGNLAELEPAARAALASRLAAARARLAAARAALEPLLLARLPHA